jgi:hypothetical protein
MEMTEHQQKAALKALECASRCASDAREDIPLPFVESRATLGKVMDDLEKVARTVRKADMRKE